MTRFHTLLAFKIYFSKFHDFLKGKISYDASEGGGGCSNRQSAIIWGRGIWPNRHVTSAVAEKA